MEISYQHFLFTHTSDEYWTQKNYNIACIKQALT